MDARPATRGPGGLLRGPPGPILSVTEWPPAPASGGPGVAFYNIRDLLGHWVKPRSMREKMCPHACCRGKRVHPANFPVILPRKLLRESTDRELMQHYGRHAGNGNARRQLEAEMERRDRASARRKASSERAFSRQLARTQEADRRWEAAERATRGNMLNERGRRAGVSERRLLTSSRDADRYASDEMRAYLDSEGRRTRTLSASGAYKVSRRAAGRRRVAGQEAARKRMAAGR